jgi:hypothetical protein
MEMREMRMMEMMRMMAVSSRGGFCSTKKNVWEIIESECQALSIDGTVPGRAGGPLCPLNRYIQSNTY